jgi:Carboxypeptidase regulatory-like domain
MKKTLLAFVALTMLATAVQAYAQKDADDGPTAYLYFVVVKDDNGKPVRNAAVIMHPVENGRQGKGGMELKTDLDGKANFDGIPYGKLRVQVLAQGFQTYGEDFDIAKPKMTFTIKMKRPQGQYSIYEDHPKDAAAPAPPQDPPPPPDKKTDKPN